MLWQARGQGEGGPMLGGATTAFLTSLKAAASYASAYGHQVLLATPELLPFAAASPAS